MPTKPNLAKLNATSPQILNAVRNEVGGDYAGMIPLAENTMESVRAIGSIIMQYQPLQNAFLSALVNRIGRVIITSRLYENPWAGFKKGLLEYGETVEEIFVNIANPNNFDPATAENEIFKRVIPDVKAAFHTMNYQKFYKVSVSNDQLRQAFLSWEGITDLIGRIIDSLYTGANYDEFLTMKYMIARMALAGNIYPVTIPALDATNARSVVTKVKAQTNELKFLSTKYNQAGVTTYTDPKFLYVIETALADAVIDVEVLAVSFNMDKAEFLGRRILVDSFAEIDSERLALLFKDDPTYKPITSEEFTTLSTIPLITVDESWFMIFDNYYNMTEQYNGEGLYWNYWYHVWKTFSASPFANAVLYTTETPQVTRVTVSPATATAKKGSTLQLTAIVATSGFASKEVTWTVTGGTKATVDASGLVTIPSDETSLALTVTAKSVFDITKTGVCAITVTV